MIIASRGFTEGKARTVDMEWSSDANRSTHANFWSILFGGGAEVVFEGEEGIVSTFCFRSLVLYTRVFNRLVVLELDYSVEAE